MHRHAWVGIFVHEKKKLLIGWEDINLSNRRFMLLSNFLFGVSFKFAFFSFASKVFCPYLLRHTDSWKVINIVEAHMPFLKNKVAVKVCLWRRWHHPTHSFDSLLSSSSHCPSLHAFLIVFVYLLSLIVLAPFSCFSFSLFSMFNMPNVGHFGPKERIRKKL